ncbi:hypothetical protein [Algoriphagus confluentis]|uniref:Uncharacterized protein n=1 Tax=Algoriphagus confluentis TaxID=1697556 RepID=A0ABQ6PUI7_9BACT|nr:hypothetical protein Aconfl_42840 [Algoriphagus confluentis]
MTAEEFKNLSKPDPCFSPELKALWLDYSGDWAGAHEVIDPLPGRSAARVHAYLHRKEGDLWNADYWYGKAGEKRPNLALPEEWETLLIRFLKDS